MKTFSRIIAFAFVRFLAWVIISGLAVSAVAQQATLESPSTDSVLKSLAALNPVDAHVHVFKSDPAFQALLEKANLKLLNILVVDDTLPYRKELARQVSDALTLVRGSKGRVALCTTFDPYKFNEPGFQKASIKQINNDFAQGAIAVKVWKNIGMEIKDSKGKFIMPDDPRLEPIYQDIAKHGKTLLMHNAEPDVAWGPPDPADPSWPYYKDNPQWFLYNKPGVPSKKEILQARDHVLAANPKLKIIGVHLGSMEKDLDGVGRVLDRNPNFAIDTAARMEYLMIAPRDQVRNFLIKYQDRIIYGTDLDLLADANTEETLNDWQSAYVRDWKFLATDEGLEVNGKKVQGLKLPESVLRKIYHTNSMTWIPGLK